MKLPKTVILAVLILLPACKTEEPPDPVQNAASSLRELGKEWEGKYREYLHYSSNTNRNICGMLSHGSQEFLQECQEVQVDQGRAFLASAYNGRSDMSRMEAASVCTSYHFLQNLSSLLPATLTTMSPLTVTFTDAQGNYQTRYSSYDSGEDTATTAANDGGFLCNQGTFDSRGFDPRREQVYIRTVSPSKLITILNLVDQTGLNSFSALRAIQYTLTYAVAVKRDYVTLLSPRTTQQRNITTEEKNSTSYFHLIVEASGTELKLLNSTVERAFENRFQDVEMGASNTSWLQTDKLFELLTDLNRVNFIPCSRVLIVFTEGDIGSDLHKTLIQAYEANRDLQVFIFDVRSSTDRRASGNLPNVDMLLCDIKAAFDSSGVNVMNISDRSSNIQSFLNFLQSPTGNISTIPITWESDPVESSLITGCISVYGDAGNAELTVKFVLGTLCLRLNSTNFVVPSADSEDSNSTCESDVEETANDLNTYFLLRQAYKSTSPACSNQTEPTPDDFTFFDSNGSSESPYYPQTEAATSNSVPIPTFSLPEYPIPTSTENPTHSSTPIPTPSSIPSPKSPHNMTQAKTFIEQVENLVRLLRNETQSILTNTSQSLTHGPCPFAENFRDSCWNGRSGLAGNETSFGCRVDRNQSFLYTGRLNDSIGDFSSEIKERICSSAALDRLWTGLPSSYLLPSNLSSVVRWFYYADASYGFLRFFPSSDCGRDNAELCGTRMFDPRLTPWYAGTIGGPKMLYLIIHVTKEENFNSIQKAALKILNTTTHRDSAAIYFNNPSGPFQQTNQMGRNNLGQFITNQSFHNNSSNGLESIFNMTFRKFESTPAYLNATECNRVIVFFSDSPLFRELPAQINNLQPEHRVDIFTFTFGGLVVDPAVPREIACLSRGEWFGTGSKSLPTVDNLIPMYLNFYSRTQGTDAVMWSEEITDILTQRKVVSACLPVFDPESVSGTLNVLGVTCIDIDIEEFNSSFGVNQTTILNMLLYNTSEMPCSHPDGPLEDRARESLRQTKCHNQPPSTPNDLLQILNSFLMESSEIQGQAFVEFVDSGNCPFASSKNNINNLDLFNPCNDSEVMNSSFSRNANFSDGVNTSYDRLGIFTQRMNKTAVDKIICPARIQSRPWTLLRERLPNITSLQFFTTEEGLLTLTYPAVSLPRDDSMMFCGDQYNHQFETNYMSAVSAGKDIVIILDLTGRTPMHSSYARIINNTFSTLASIDYFTILAGNITLNHLLVSANDTNFREAYQMLVNMTEYLPARQEDLISRAFSVLSNSRQIDKSVIPSALCQSAIIIITNRDIGPEIPSLVQQENEQFVRNNNNATSVNVFVNTININTNVTTASSERDSAALELVCNNSGIWNSIPPNDAAAASQLVNGYTRVLARFLVIRKPLWNYNSLGLIDRGASLCLPVYDENAIHIRLLGLTCITVPVDEFRRFSDPSRRGEEFLAEVIANQRLVRPPYSITELSPEDINNLRPAERQCQNPPLSHGSISPSLPTQSLRPSTAIATSSFPSSLSSSPEPQPSTVSSSETHPTTRHLPRLIKKYIILIIVISVVLFFTFICLCYISASLCRKGTRKPRYKEFGKSTEEDENDFGTTDYQKLHENMSKKDE